MGPKRVTLLYHPIVLNCRCQDYQSPYQRRHFCSWYKPSTWGKCTHSMPAKCYASTQRMVPLNTDSASWQLWYPMEMVKVRLKLCKTTCQCYSPRWKHFRVWALQRQESLFFCFVFISHRDNFRCQRRFGRETDSNNEICLGVRFALCIIKALRLARFEHCFGTWSPAFFFLYCFHLSSVCVYVCVYVCVCVCVCVCLPVCVATGKETFFQTVCLRYVCLYANVYVCGCTHHNDRKSGRRTLGTTRRRTECNKK